MTKKFEQISRISGFMKHNGGLFFKEKSKSEFIFKTTITKKHLNKRKITHGGYICSIIDAGAGTGVFRATGGQSCVTVSLEIKFIGMTKLKDEIIGKVKILKKTNSTVFLICNLFSRKKIIASASGVWRILKKKPVI
tara:strand:+ start:1028 stop:1438 length:411 start_codon:yes stop_codon:yes gene_type:complete